MGRAVSVIGVGIDLVDLDRIKREFARVMSGTYHKRTGYPRAAGPAPELETAERA